jgi:hypothetical protein
MISPFIPRVRHASALAVAAFSIAMLVTAALPAASQTPCGGCSATGGAGSGKIGIVIRLS